MCYEFFHCCSAINRRKDTPVTESSRQEATTLPTDPYADPKLWRKAMVKYQQPSRAKASWQLINTLLPFIGVWVAMYFVYDVSPWLTIPLMILAGGLCVRLFIIFHDCGHKSFFKSKRAGNIWGFITGILTFTPYQFWHWEHSIHHATSGDLDHREEGEVWTMTVEEYEKSSKWLKLGYRLVRNPFILFTISPLYLFLIWHRFSSKKAKLSARLSVLWTNLGIAAMFTTGILIMGLKKYLILQLGVCVVFSSVGVWLFYVQHQFEGIYWERKSKWDFVAAALQGSSYYKLPKVLQWFSGNIGYHHIHHLSARIPNYRLQECHDAEEMFEAVPVLTLRSSLACVKHRLWDEENSKLVSFKYLKEYRAKQKNAA
jgi:omega-6 fatty acid desaturase (delta-12 desaturase)